MSKAESTPWGGFVIQGKDSQLVAAHTIFLWSGSSDAQPIDGDHKRGLGHRNDVPLISVSFHGYVQIESSQLVYGAGQAIVASTGASVDINYSLIQGFACGLQCTMQVYILIAAYSRISTSQTSRNGNPLTTWSIKILTMTQCTLLAVTSA